MLATDWQTRVGDSWAAEWRRTDRAFSDLSSHLDAAIAAAAPAQGQVVDLGCGAGQTSIALAQARTDLAIIGIDLSPALITIARERAGDTPTLRFAVGAVPDALAPHAPFDFAFSRHGVMFFDDPAAAFRGIAAALVPGAPLIFSCFRAARENEWASDIAAAIGGGPEPEPEPGYVPGPFAFADPNLVATLLADAGFTAIDWRATDFTYRAGEGADAIDEATAFFTRIGPAARALVQLAPDDRPAATARLRDAVARRYRDDAVNFPAAAWIWSARRG